jgi:Ser/Thr protein kinase RdoA (MazF antagonist)
MSPVRIGARSLARPLELGSGLRLSGSGRAFGRAVYAREAPRLKHFARHDSRDPSHYFPRMRHFELAEARLALERWEGDAGSLEHVATSGNSVYRFHATGTPRILRLTELEYRTERQNDAEMAFLEHLRASGLRVNAPIRSRAGRRVEEIEGGSAVVLDWAPGIRVDPGSPAWNSRLLFEWGATLAAIHRAATTYLGPERWEWWQEGLIADARTLIPAADRAARAELELVMAKLSALPRARESYGMTHGDFAQQNFNFDPRLGITVFDFGNCCHHWFASDLVISLSTLRRLPERERYRDWLLDGYRSVRTLEDDAWEARGWLMRLRVLYVYLSRLRKFGSQPTPEERQTLELLSALVAEHGGREAHAELAAWM